MTTMSEPLRHWKERVGDRLPAVIWEGETPARYDGPMCKARVVVDKQGICCPEWQETDSMGNTVWTPITNREGTLQYPDGYLVEAAFTMMEHGRKQ